MIFMIFCDSESFSQARVKVTIYLCFQVNWAF